MKLKPKDAINFKIRERKENYSSFYIFNYSKDDLLKKVAFYVKQKFINEKIETALKEIGVLIGKKNDLEIKKSNLENEKYEMTEEQGRLRENISVLGETTQESKLREKYVTKLTTQENRFESISAEIKKLETELDALNSDIDKKISKLKVK